MAHPLVTVETVRDYIASRGGVVKNVELVRHFRLFLQQEDPERKGFDTSISMCFKLSVFSVVLQLRRVVYLRTT